MSTLRVRQILASLDSVARADLKKLLPPKLALPDLTTERYPSMLLSCLPDSYSTLGFIAEEMLRLPSSEITLDALIATTYHRVPDLPDEAVEKIRKSKTTQPFLDALIRTRKGLEKVLRSDEGPLEFEKEVVYQSVAGHPDMSNKTQVFEVKLTGMLKQNWVDFLFQVFAYGAIMPEAKVLYLVLPLQKVLLGFDVETWSNRQAYRDFLVKYSTHRQTDGFEMMLQSAALCNTYHIGCHVQKQKQLLSTVSMMGDYSKPYQIFLGGPQNSRIAFDPADAAAALAFIQKTGAKIFIHSQYIINLCAKDVKEDWSTQLLIKNLQVGRAMGALGVVVHVGKSTKQDYKEAVETMRGELKRALEHASVECPLLLETPAGQGTETLRGQEEFLDFVSSFKDPRLRACVDTCHVFACGHNPETYLTAAIARSGLVKLVHYNDSHGTCGSCVDRHAACGTGKIGFEGMKKLAQLCASANIPMVIE